MNDFQNTTVHLQCMYTASCGENINILISCLPKDLGLANWLLDKLSKLELPFHTVLSSQWEDNTIEQANLLNIYTKIDTLIMNTDKAEILKTATVYNGGTTPEWRDAVIYFIAFELGIDPIDVPEWWTEIL